MKKTILFLLFSLVLFIDLKYAKGTPLQNEEKILPNDKVIVRNRYGSITIIGWDRDYIQTLDRSDDQSIRVDISSEPSSNGRVVTINKISGSSNSRMELKLPKITALQLVETSHGDINI